MWARPKAGAACLSSSPRRGSTICGVRLRQGYGGKPSRGLPTVAHADVDKRERRLVSRIFASWNQIGKWLRRLDAVRRTA
jgi:hypothetical protein